MKKLVVCLTMVLSAGCVGQSYQSTRVGPNRFVVVSRGHDIGPENYGHILEQAYITCHAAGFKDYVVNNVAFETRRVVAFVQCHEEIQQRAMAKEETDESSVMSDIDALYQSAKKKIKEHIKE